MTNKLIIGVIGAGHLGRFHISKLTRIRDVSFIGFYDTSVQRSDEISEEFNIQS